MVFITALLPILFIIFIIFVMVSVSKSKENGGAENMFKQLYVYLVLFATLMMTIGGGVSVFMGTAEFISPTTYTQSFVEYQSMREGEVSEKSGGKNVLSQQQLKSEYDTVLKDEKNRAKEEAKNTIIKSFGFIVIPFPIFLYFNRQRKKGE